MAEKTIVELRKENETLNNQLKDSKSMYEQLLNEKMHENYDEWRVLLLKSQLIQMERQNLILSESLATRSSTLLEIENSLCKLADSWRVYIAKDIQGPDVPVPRAHIMKMVEIAESIRLKVSKSVENSSIEIVAKPAMLMGDFIKPNTSNFDDRSDVTLLDICSGNLDHINLKHVSKLETKLFSLYKQLTCLENSIKTVLPSNFDLGVPVYEHACIQIDKSRDAIKKVNQDLLNLTVLIPAAPWPPLQKSKNREISVANVMSKFSKLTPKYRNELKEIVTALVKALNYSLNASVLEAQAVKQELEFHQEIYEHQVLYVNSLFEAVEKSYGEFQESSRLQICQPLSELLMKYKELKTTTDSETLKDFLTAFKENADKLTNACEQIQNQTNDEHKQQSPMQDFNLNFMEKLERVKSDCREKRDKTLLELDCVKKERDAHRDYLQQLLVPVAQSAN